MFIPLFCVVQIAQSEVIGQELKEIYNSQEETIPRESKSEAIAGVRLPPGFSIQVAAEDPEVQQPIGMSWDSKGRLWIAENYTYSESKIGFDTSLRDRIIILEDTDQDGVFDHRKVFWDQGIKLTSIEVVKGGVWVMAPPKLMFIPDIDQDDLPDSLPETVLQGFHEGMRHNVANGLRIGPDGWLYGRHGILGVSRVELVKPASYVQLRSSHSRVNAQTNSFALRNATTSPKPSDPITIHCGIWRYHPSLHRVEIVCQGTTNPWGMDWDAYGNLFFINTVIGHLWHAIPNSHMQRMYGEDLDPFAYELLPQIADHVHWDEKGEDWRETRKGPPSDGTDRAGGGHAHSGLLIYQGDQWPEQYRGKLFTLNFHGRRLNQERLDRQGAGFVGKHERDMVFWKDPWFRGIDLSTGPDGSVYVLDWSDIGECHDDDGIHRTSGRIYRISYSGDGQIPKNVKTPDMADMSRNEAMAYLNHPNPWYYRQILNSVAHRLLKPAGNIEAKLLKAIREGATSDGSPLTIAKVQYQLRCLQLYIALEKRPSLPFSLVELLREGTPVELKIGALQLFLAADLDETLGDNEIHESAFYFELIECLDSQGVTNADPLLRLYAAALIPKLMIKDWRLADRLMQSSDLINDRDFSLVLWYGIKDFVAKDPLSAAKLVNKCKLPKVKELIIRRLVALQSQDSQGIDWVVGDVAGNPKNEHVSTLAGALLKAYEGRNQVKAPNGWERLSSSIERHPDPTVREQGVLLRGIFQGNTPVEKLLEIAKDERAALPTRRAALDSLGAIVTNEETRTALWNLLADPVVGEGAALALGKQGSKQDALRMVEIFSQAGSPGKQGILTVLSSKTDWLPVLLDAVEQQKISSDKLDASTWRQISLIGSWEHLERARKIRPALFSLEKDKEAAVLEMEKWLTDEQLQKGDLQNGRRLWDKHCASCHKLFGTGGSIGPELTGSQRGNKRFWIENILAPSAQVASNYRVEIVQLDDSSVHVGVPVNETVDTLTIQTTKDRVVLEKKDIENRKQSELSLMPDGLLSTLDDSSRRDLFRYLMSPSQVAP